MVDVGADSELFGPEFKSRLYARYAICAGHSLDRENVEEVYQEALERLKDCGNVAVVCRWFAELLVSFAEVRVPSPRPTTTQLSFLCFHSSMQ